MRAFLGEASLSYRIFDDLVTFDFSPDSRLPGSKETIQRQEETMKDVLYATVSLLAALAIPAQMNGEVGSLERRRDCLRRCHSSVPARRIEPLRTRISF
jgi:hypothetical protein